jgi:hypothetical protein
VANQEGHEANGNHPQEGLGRTGEVGEESAGTTEVGVGRGEISDPEELRARLGMKDNRIRELYEEITAFRLAADEARASKERELERKDGEISHRDQLLERRAEQLEAASRRVEELASRKDLALQDALRRVDGLERDLEGREDEILNLQATVETLRGELEAERELRSRLADPANRLRAGIDLFNESEQRRSMNALCRTLGQPEVHVELDEGEEPPALLTFTWQGVTWQTYAADPGPDVEEPRVYLKGAGEDLSGVDRKPPNARVGPGERVMLGL